MGILGLYTGIFLLTRIGGGKKKAVEASSASSSVTADDEMPSVDSPAFENWISTPGNIEKALASFEK